MGPRRYGIHIQCIHGHHTSPNETALEEFLRSIAGDAVRNGRGREQPWVVDANGKMVRALRPYVEYLTPMALYRDSREISPVVRAQNADVAFHLSSCQLFLDQTVAGMLDRVRDTHLLDPIAKVLHRQLVRAIVSGLLTTLEDGQALAEEAERLPVDVPTREG